MTIIYGIKQCSTMKKAFCWLDAHNAPYEFVDFKKTPPSRSLLETWIRHAPWTQLVNTRGTTWRKIPEIEKQNIGQDDAIKLMLAYPSLIKRPILSSGDKILVGFDETLYSSILEARNA